MRALGIATTVLIAVGASAVFAAQEQIPSDFRIVAHFGSGHIPVTEDDLANGQIGAWYLRLDARGVANVEVIRNSPRKKTTTSIRYSRREIIRVVEAVARSRFFTLPRFIDAGFTDVPNYSLEVTMRGKTHAVRVASPSALRDKSLLKRFIAVWVIVCQRMPSQFDDGVTRDLQKSS
jgi:hypothetical protein